jgi:hypothetical protein
MNSEEAKNNGHTHTPRERALAQANDFHAVLLAMAGHDLRQPFKSC